uniref:Uncharacterized protein n=1 Tax=Knipowitschia caucasica TaxID=637954 RepID=A0AAV2KK09_KNICA
MKRLVQRGRWFLPEKNDQPLSRPFPYTHEQAPPTIGGIAPSSSLTANFLIRALMKLVNEQQNNWDTFLDATLFSLRSKVHISTKHTPFQLMYGREAVFPSEVPVDYPCSRRQSWHFLDPPIKAFGGFEEGKNSRFTRTLPNVTATHQWNLRVRRRLTYKQNRAMRVCPIVQRRAK